MINMMENTPIKFRILEFLEDGPKRTDEICIELGKEYGLDNRYGRGKIKFDCIELASAGILTEGVAIVDEEGILDKGKLLTMYCLSDLGKDYLEYLKKTVKPRAKV
jgi:hypothetical protein